MTVESAYVAEAPAALAAEDHAVGPEAEDARDILSGQAAGQAAEEADEHADERDDDGDQEESTAGEAEVTPGDEHEESFLWE